MYLNTFLPVMSLQKAPVSSGGLCAIKFCKWEDVLTWPRINPSTGIMDSTIALKPGAVMYYAEMIDATRSYQEKQKNEAPGVSFDITVSGNLRGSNASNLLSVTSMLQHQWVLIVQDRGGFNRLVGNQDSGAQLVYNYDSGNIGSSRKTELTFKWEHPLPAPIYSANAFDIIIGGVLITAGCLRLVIRFKVGAAGSPMNAGDTILINDLFSNKQILVMADGFGLPVDDLTGGIDWSTSIQRHVEHGLASNTINFVGSVVTDEIIEIYAFN